MFTIGLQLHWMLTPTQNLHKFMNDKNNKLQNKVSSFLTRHCYYSIFCKDTAIRLYTNRKSFTQHLYETSLAKTSIHRTYDISNSWFSFLNKYMVSNNYCWKAIFTLSHWHRNQLTFQTLTQYGFQRLTKGW